MPLISIKRIRHVLHSDICYWSKNIKITLYQNIMFLLLLCSIYCEIKEGDMFYIKQNGEYVGMDDVKNVQFIYEKDESPLFVLKNHNLGGYSFEVVDKNDPSKQSSYALNYSSKYNQGRLYYSGLDKPNNNWYIKYIRKNSRNSYMIKIKANNPKTCATHDVNKMIFETCNEGDARQELEMELVRDKEEISGFEGHETESSRKEIEKLIRKNKSEHTETDSDSKLTRKVKNILKTIRSENIVKRKNSESSEINRKIKRILKKVSNQNSSEEIKTNVKVKEKKEGRNILNHIPMTVHLQIHFQLLIIFYIYQLHAMICL